MKRKDGKFSLGCAEFESSVGLSSTKGHFWNSRALLRYRSVVANDVEVIVETTGGEGTFRDRV